MYWFDPFTTSKLLALAQTQEYLTVLTGGTGLELCSPDLFVTNFQWAPCFKKQEPLPNKHIRSMPSQFVCEASAQKRMSQLASHETGEVRSLVFVPLRLRWYSVGNDPARPGRGFPLREAIEVIPFLIPCLSH